VATTSAVAQRAKAEGAICRGSGLRCANPPYAPNATYPGEEMCIESQCPLHLAVDLSSSYDFVNEVGWPNDSKLCIERIT
jgi:hypothetical protein